MRINEALENLGLSEKEVQVYLALLKLGRSSAAGVALEAKLKRPTTYVILGDLMQKGLVLKTPRARKQLFTAKSPQEFFAEAREKLVLAESILPQIIAISEKPGKKFKVLFYEGISGLLEMYQLCNRQINGKELLGFFARIIPGPGGHELEEKVFNVMNEERRKLGIKTRGLSVDDPSLQRYREHATELGYELKWLDPKDYTSDTSIEIGADFIQISSHRYLQGVHIENPDIASTMRQIFEMVWQSRPESVLKSDAL